MERKVYDIPEVDVLSVETDVITTESYDELAKWSAPRVSVSKMPGK